MTILIVDDDELTRSLLQKKLEKLGYSIELADSGEQALKAVDTKQIDLVLLDMIMPGMSGVEALSKIRETYSNAELPVIMMTADDDTKGATINSLNAGANDFIEKPVNMEVAHARLQTHLSMSNLHQQKIKAKQLETITAMITTYNHEINNPLAIAMGLIQRSSLTEDKERFEKVMRALNRIRDIVVKIRALQVQNVELKDYTKDSKMMKL